MPIRRKDKKGNRHWYGRVRDPKSGQTREKKCLSQLEAMQWETAVLSDSADLTQIDTVSTGALVNQFLDDLQERANRAQVQMKYFNEAKRALAPFANFIGPDIPAARIVRRDVSKYLNHVADTISVNTALVAHKHIKRLKNWAHQELQWPQDWLILPPKLKRTEPVKRPWFTPEEITKLLAAATSQERLMLECFIELAARKNELFGLRWSEVDLSRRTVTLTSHKGNQGVEERTLPLPPALAERLRKHRRAHMNTVYVLTNPSTGTRYAGNSTALDRLCKRAGVPKVPGRAFHGLRRLAAVTDTETAQARLGHKHPTTTAIYQEQLRETRRLPCLLDRLQMKKAPESNDSKASSGE